MIHCLQQFQQFLEHSERSPLTIKNYLCDLNAFAEWFQETNGDALSPEKITPTDLREYKRWLLFSRGLKPASLNRKLATLKSFLKWASDLQLVGAFVPAKAPKLEREERPGPRWLDRREQNALLRAVEQRERPRDIAIIKLLLNTGLRVQELCDLTWQDVLITDRKGMLTVQRGKGGKRRQVPLNTDARNALLQIGYSRLAGKTEPIFCGQRGPLTPRGIQIMLDRYASSLRDPAQRLSPHVLRHTFCKNLVDAGVGLEKVAALAGHESLDTTRRYCEPSLKDLERVVELIGEGE